MKIWVNINSVPWSNKYTRSTESNNFFNPCFSSWNISSFNWAHTLASKNWESSPKHRVHSQKHPRPQTHILQSFSGFVHPPISNAKLIKFIECNNWFNCSMKYIDLLKLKNSIDWRIPGQLLLSLKSKAPVDSFKSQNNRIDFCDKRKGNNKLNVNSIPAS